MAAYPSFLPLPTQDLSVEAIPSMVVSEFKSGRIRQRKVNDSHRKTMAVVWTLDDDEKYKWWGWYEHELENGSLEFDISMPFGDGLKTNTASILGGAVSENMLSAFNWEISATLYVENPVRMSSVEYAAL